MANTQKKYSLDNFARLPLWLKRSWCIFERINLRADYKKHIKRISGLNKDRKELAYEVINIVRDYKFGQGLDELIRAQINNPDIENDELLNLIPPPMRFVNFGKKLFVPNKSGDEFENNEKMRQFIIQKSGVDVRTSEEVHYLIIPANTTKQELKSFIDMFYDEMAEKFFDNTDLYFESDKNTRKRITRPSLETVIDERIYELYSEGHKGKAISLVINKEFDKDFAFFDINKRLNQFKKRKGRQ